MTHQPWLSFDLTDGLVLTDKSTTLGLLSFKET